MTLRLLIDMNLSPSWVEVLREAGFEAEHWYRVGAPNAPDSELFAWARENEHIAFTHDLDFGALLAATRAESPSVFQIRTDDVSPDTLAPRAIELLRRFTRNSRLVHWLWWMKCASASGYCRYTCSHP
jgi:predicted nuclease of predicted toxin-antitoxin system